MRIPGLGRVRKAGKWVAGQFTSKAVILLYHRVARLSSDPQLLSVTPEHFVEHLDIMRQIATPLRLGQFVQALNDGSLPRRAVVVTFDDGYADNLHNAKPLLAHHGIPATVFVTAGYVGKEREFWWDEVERLLLQPGALPEEIHLNIDGRTFQWELAGSSHYSEDDYRRCSSWHAMEKTEPTRRHTLYKTLCQLLRALPERDKRKTLDELMLQTGAEPKTRPTYQPLSAGEVVRLAEGSLVEIGAHTVTHPVLSGLPVEDQRVEIEQSKMQLEALLGRPVTTFAYPFGTRADYTARTAAMVQDAGFRCACSNFVGVIGRDVGRFELPRAIVRDWSGEEFGQRLKRWFTE